MTPTESAFEAGPGGWRVRLRAVWRALVVIWGFLPLLLAYARDRRRFLLFGGRREVSAADRYRRARFLRDRFVALGPAFIKLGQMLSTRPDVLPGEYVEVLSELQDRVPPDPWGAVRPVIEADVGPVDERFDDFDTEPISGASLGQVYEAELDGERVAVKVLRPDVRARVESDLRVLGALVPLLARFSPPGQAFTLSNLAEEFAATVREEMDYAHEAAMLHEIGGNLAADDRIRVPGVIESHSTDRVLTMEYVEGTKVDDLAALDDMGIDRSALVERLERAYIRMIVEDGRFHADPHPGNLAVQADGTLVFYDFGMTGSLDAETREHLQSFYVGLATRDLDRVIDAFAAMGALDPAADRNLLRELFAVAIDQFRGEDIEQYRIEELIGQFQGAMYEFPLRIPQNLAMVVRVTSVLEGVARTLDPEYDFIATITEYVGRTGMGPGSEAVVDAATEQVRATGRALVRTPPRLERTLDAAARGDLSVRMALADGDGTLARLARRLILGFVVALGPPATAVLYTAAGPNAAVGAGAVAVGAAALLYRSFRSRPRLRMTSEMTRRGLDRRRPRE